MDPLKPVENRYESIVEAYKRGELWPTGPCKTIGCSAEGPIELSRFQSARQRKDFATDFW